MEIFVLICHSKHDRINSLLSYLQTESIIPYVQTKGFKVLNFDNKKFMKKNVKTCLKKKDDIKFIIFNGHGKEDRIFGYKDEEIIVLNENEELLKDKIVFSISCESVKKLGKKSVEDGNVKTFIGYKGKFIVTHDEDQFFNKEDDKLLEYCLHLPKSLILNILKGKTIKESHNESIKSYEKVYEKLSNNDNLFTLNVEQIRKSLFWNHSQQTFYGDGEAKL